MITKSQIDAVVEAIVEFYQPEKIILFGSYAVGTASEDSDLDLAIVKKTSQTWFRRGRDVRMAIRKAGQVHFFSKDILVFTPEELAAQTDDQYSVGHKILKTGKTLYERSESASLVNQG